MSSSPNRSSAMSELASHGGLRELCGSARNSRSSALLRFWNPATQAEPLGGARRVHEIGIRPGQGANAVDRSRTDRHPGRRADAGRASLGRLAPGPGGGKAAKDVCRGVRHACQTGPILTGEDADATHEWQHGRQPDTLHPRRPGRSTRQVTDPPASSSRSSSADAWPLGVGSLSGLGTIATSR